MDVDREVSQLKAPDPILKQVLSDYLQITEFEHAEAWIKKQPCSPSKKREFLQRALGALNGIGISVEIISFDGVKKVMPVLSKEDDCFDYIDYLRVRHECNGSATR